MNRKRCFIPETERVNLETRTVVACEKPENHRDKYRSPNKLLEEDLPANWRREEMLNNLKIASRRVVHLTVLKQSPSRLSRGSENMISFGSGCLTFHPFYGAIIHTSKHVVYDPFEVDRTIVRVFYDEENTVEVEQAIAEFRNKILREVDGDNLVDRDILKNKSNQQSNVFGLFLSKGNCRHFQSVMCSDYTSFSCDLPIHELFGDDEICELAKSFSWFNFNVWKMSLSPPKNIDIAIISHPHGYYKKISFGSMNKLCNVTPALYDAATCGGSSGAPLIRLKEDVGHINMGMFVHHGHNKEILDMGVGTVRPPWTFPYIKCLDTENTLTNAIDILYEPIFYWTLFVCDLLQIESTLTNVLDVFAYTSSLNALLFTVDCILFKILFTFYWLHIICKSIVDSYRTGLYYAVCNVIGTLISMAMFPIAWLILHLYPWGRGITEIVACLVWIIVLYFERFFSLSTKFQMKTMGSFTEVIQYELGIKAKTSKKSRKLVTTAF